MQVDWYNGCKMAVVVVYGLHAGQPVCISTPSKNQWILLKQSFAAHMPLLIATAHSFYENMLEFCSQVLPAPSTSPIWQGNRLIFRPTDHCSGTGRAVSLVCVCF